MTPTKDLKSFFKSSFPRTAAAYLEMRRTLRQPSLKTVFSEIYHKNAWSDSESVSGRGSTLARTAVIRSQLPALLQELQAETLLDAACGDFNWMRHTELGRIKYIGVDIVPELVAGNQRLHGGAEQTFMVLDISRSRLPRANVILCRECFIHLSFRTIKSSISNFKKSGAEYLLATSHTSVTKNIDCADGGWRSVNLQAPPFNFPPPLKLIVEDAKADKCLGLWRMGDL